MIEKQQAIRSKHIREAARGQDCTMHSPACNGDPATVVWCHSNMSIHGKGGARKADDVFGFFGCSGCNWWYDDGPASQEEKESYFLRANGRSILILIRLEIIQVKGAA